jgi:hypothetical protein
MAIDANKYFDEYDPNSISEQIELKGSPHICCRVCGSVVAASKAERHADWHETLTTHAQAGEPRRPWTAYLLDGFVMPHETFQALIEVAQWDEKHEHTPECGNGPCEGWRDEWWGLLTDLEMPQEIDQRIPHRALFMSRPY